MTKFTFLFDGQNASTGTPNKNTGRMSFYGSVHKFTNRAEAIEYAEKRDTGYSSCIVEIGGRQKMRQFCLGMTTRDFNEYLNFLVVDECVL